MPQTMNAALGALSAETSGSGSALISALRQVGATIGVAVLGTVLASVYRSHLVVTGLPDAGRLGRQEQCRGRRRDRKPDRLGAVARLGAARVRRRDGHHALGLRRDPRWPAPYWRSSSCRGGPTAERSARRTPAWRATYLM